MIELDIYVEKNTFIHKLHPSTKIISLFLSFLLLIILNNPWHLLLIFILIVITIIVSGTLSNILRLRWLILILFFMSFILWSIIVRGGERCIDLKFISITCRGINAGFSAGLRITGMLFAGLLFIFTTRIEEISAGLVLLKIPYRFVFALTTAIRLLPTFLGAGSIIIEAQESRGHDVTGGSLFRRIKNYIPLLIPSFLYGMRNVNQLSIALEARGFSTAGKRSRYLELKFTALDFIIIMLMVFLLAGGIFLRFKNL